jgi:hypothetical protein
MISITPSLKRYQILLILILSVAAVLRFLNLGYPPLQDVEAVAALRATEGTPHASTFSTLITISLHQPAYETLTRVVFQLFGASTSNARLIPAIAGVLLVFMPYLARRRLGLGTSLMMSVFLAISPIFVTLSRTASGASLAILGLSTWLVLSLARERKVLGALGLGLAIASGPAIFNGLIILVVTRGILRRNADDGAESPGQRMLWLVPITVVAIATSIGWSYGGLSDFFESIVEYLKGWTVLGPFSTTTTLAILPLYAPTLTFFAILGIWKAVREKSPLLIGAVVAVGLGLILLLFYRGREPQDISWVVLAMSFLAADYLASLFQSVVTHGFRSSSLILTIGLLILIGSLGVQLSRFLRDPQLAEQSVALLIFISALGGILVLIGTFSLGWSWEESKMGILLAFGAGFLTLSVSSIWHLNFRPYAATANEVWRDNVASEGLLLLTSTLETTAEMVIGLQGTLAVDLYDLPPPSILWALRDKAHIHTGENSNLPDVVLAREGDRELNLPADYLGQSMSLGESWAWFSVFPPDFLQWWFNRNSPVITHRWLVLIREDLIFPETLNVGEF